MLKKLIVVIVLTATLTTTLVAVGVNLKEEEPAIVEEVKSWDALIAESYPDYRSEVYLDKGDDPEMNELGLFWCKYNPLTHEIEWVPADTAEGAKLIDSSKPTVINVHGMMTDGHLFTEKYYVKDYIGNLDELGLSEADGWDYSELRTLALWIEKGWNVGVYCWHRFTSESIDFAKIEAKVWSTEGSGNVRWRSEDGSYHENPIEYAVAELFVGDYLRAVDLLPEDFGKEEIRFTAHSMGGELVSAASFLLYEISKGENAQISRDKVPDRMTMDDTFFGAYANLDAILLDMSEKGLHIRWSGKAMPEDRTGRAVVEAIKYLAAEGVVIDYYSYEGSFLNLAIIEEDRQALLESMVYILISPQYQRNPDYGSYDIMTDGHVAVRHFSQVSIMRDYLGGDLSDTEKVAYANALPTEEMKTLVGKTFKMTDGVSTVTTADDVYVEITHEEELSRNRLGS